MFPSQRHILYLPSSNSWGWDWSDPVLTKYIETNGLQNWIVQSYFSEASLKEMFRQQRRTPKLARQPLTSIENTHTANGTTHAPSSPIALLSPSTGNGSSEFFSMAPVQNIGKRCTWREVIFEDDRLRKTEQGHWALMAELRRIFVF